MGAASGGAGCGIGCGMGSGIDGLPASAVTAGGGVPSGVELGGAASGDSAAGPAPVDAAQASVRTEIPRIRQDFIASHSCWGLTVSNKPRDRADLLSHIAPTGPILA